MLKYYTQGFDFPWSKTLRHYQFEQPDISTSRSVVWVWGGTFSFWTMADRGVFGKWFIVNPDPLLIFTMLLIRHHLCYEHNEKLNRYDSQIITRVKALATNHNKNVFSQAITTYIFIRILLYLLYIILYFLFYLSTCRFWNQFKLKTFKLEVKVFKLSCQAFSNQHQLSILTNFIVIF